MVRFSKFTSKKEIYEKFEEFLSKLIWKKNLLNFLYIFILSVNFENLTVGLYVLILFFMLIKFQKDQKSIAMSLNKY